jgi:hypothetical protein
LHQAAECQALVLIRKAWRWFGSCARPEIHALIGWQCRIAGRKRGSKQGGGEENPSSADFRHLLSLHDAALKI